MPTLGRSAGRSAGRSSTAGIAISITGWNKATEAPISASIRWADSGASRTPHASAPPMTTSGTMYDVGNGWVSPCPELLDGCCFAIAGPPW